MKRIFAIIFFVLTVLALLGALIWCGYCAWDHHKLLLTPGISGIDFLMIGVSYGIGLGVFCAVGAVCALVQSRLTGNSRVQIFDYIATGLCLLGLFAAFVLIFI